MGDQVLRLFADICLYRYYPICLIDHIRNYFAHALLRTLQEKRTYEWNNINRENKLLIYMIYSQFTFTFASLYVNFEHM